jgi:hypothetical protein
VAQHTPAAVERRHESVAGRGAMTPAEAADLAARHVVVLLLQREPGAVTETQRQAGRVDDVGEEHGREDARRAIGAYRVLRVPLLVEYSDHVPHGFRLCKVHAVR